MQRGNCNIYFIDQSRSRSTDITTTSVAVTRSRDPDTADNVAVERGGNSNYMSLIETRNSSVESEPDSSFYNSCTGERNRTTTITTAQCKEIK